MADLIAITGTLQQTATMATPLVLAALGENVVQRAGVVNVGLEGMMLSGAFGATVITFWTGNPLLGLLTGAGIGLLAGLVFALFAIRLAANQVVVGIVVNLLALGVTGTLYQALFGKSSTGLSTAALPRLFWDQTLLFPVALVAVPLVWWWLSRTRHGLELRACGEQPVAAEASGVNVLNLRTLAALFGGMMAGVAGAFLSIGSSNTFVPEMTEGRGFIALAIVTSGRWNPFGCLIASAVFGFADALQYRGQSLGIPIPKDLLLALPYLITIVILMTGSSGGQGPAALGKPYRRA